MKSFSPLFLTGSFLIVSVASAQRAPAGAPNPMAAAAAANSAANQAASPGGQAANPGGANNPQNSDLWAIAERTLNSDNWSVDSDNGVFQWKNNKFDIGSNLAVRQRFERYLSSPGFGDTLGKLPADHEANRGLPFQRHRGRGAE